MSLKLSNNSIDLGKMRVGQSKSFSVQIVNSTATDIPITSIKVGCGKCTTARMETNKVKAYSSEPLSVVFTPTSTGINRKTITINQSIILNFSAQVS